jgi:hypothetical protein
VGQSGCLNCRHRFGEAILDLHHGFSVPPPPQTVTHPVYDPTHRRLLLRLAEVGSVVIAAEIRIRAQRKAGELLKEMEKHKGGQGKKPVT